jgi:3-mercaptopyruvate sulfurtransferase SseA
MNRKNVFWKFAGFSMVLSVLFVTASNLSADPIVVSAGQLYELLTGKGKGRVLVVDVRPYDEYREAHVPGAINIPEERISTSRSRLPKDRSVPIVFYCRGMG